MAKKQTRSPDAILQRALRALPEISEEAATYLERLNLDSADQARFRSLEPKKNRGVLSPDEQAELDALNLASAVLGALVSQAHRKLEPHRKHTARASAQFVAALRRFLAPFLTPTIARRLVALRLDEKTQARIHALATKNSEGRLSRAEHAELDGFVRAGDIVAILQSLARIALKGRE